MKDSKEVPVGEALNPHLVMIATPTTSNALSEAMGISEERIEELKKTLDDILSNQDSNLSEDFESYSKRVKTPAELIWGVFQIGQHVGREKERHSSLGSLLSR